jgi:LysR family nitrogen assimilation transcriptional regulator
MTPRIRLVIAMDIRQLNYFVTIVDCGSLGRAAEKLNVAQPSLSQQIIRLEDELKTVLLIRSRQGVSPTAEGQALYRHGRLVLRQMEQLRQEVRLGTSQETGTVAVGLPTAVVTILAMPLVQRLQARYPGIRLQLFESMSGYISELLAGGRLDLAILFRDVDTRGITALPLLEEQLYVVGEPGNGVGARAETCPMARLSGVPMVAPGASNGLRILLERVFSRERIELNIVADIDSLPTLISIAQAGLACTILPASALAQWDVMKRPKMRRLTGPSLKRPVSLCWSNAMPIHSATLAVRQTIIDLVGELSASGLWAGISLPPR